MACETKLWLLVVLVFFSATCMQQCCVHGKPQLVPCFFIFGDSLADSGNNNNLKTDAKVNYHPYGVDFPGGPSGRFTNGRTAADIITQILGFDNFIPPFRNTNGSDILQGVNYASGGAGIRNETGKHLGDNISLEPQLDHHRAIISQISRKLESVDKGQDHLKKCLYYVNIGSNDYLNNYFLPEHYPSKRRYSPAAYAGALIQQYSKGLKALHGLGARKFVLYGLNLLGCIPNEIITHGKNKTICVADENEAALIFNDKLKRLVGRLNKELSDAKFIYVNSAVITYHNFTNLAGISGLEDLHCCTIRSDGQCATDKDPCPHRNLYAFWDAFHPTEIINQFIARCSYTSPIPTYTYPMDISHLIKL